MKSNIRVQFSMPEDESLTTKTNVTFPSTSSLLFAGVNNNILGGSKSSTVKL